MARIGLVEPLSATPEVQQIYEHRLHGKPNNFHRAMGHQPGALLPFLSFYSAVGRSLERRVYEQVYVRVSMLNRCEYCTQHHMAAARRAGVTPDELRALRDGRLHSFREQEQAALAYAEKLTRAPFDITDADVRSLKTYFTEPQIVDLHLLVGLANFTNRITGPLGLELEFASEAF